MFLALLVGSGVLLVSVLFNGMATALNAELAKFAPEYVTDPSRAIFRRWFLA